MLFWKETSMSIIVSPASVMQPKIISSTSSAPAVSPVQPLLKSVPLPAPDPLHPVEMNSHHLQNPGITINPAEGALIEAPIKTDRIPDMPLDANGVTKKELPPYKTTDMLVAELKQNATRLTPLIEKIDYHNRIRFSSFQKIVLGLSGAVTASGIVLSVLSHLGILGSGIITVPAILSNPYMAMTYVGVSALIIGFGIYFAQKYYYQHSRIDKALDAFYKDADLDKTQFKGLHEALQEEHQRLRDFEATLSTKEKRVFRSEIQKRKVLLRKQQDNLIEIVVKFMTNKRNLTEMEFKMLSILFSDKVVLTKIAIEPLITEKKLAYRLNIERLMDYIQKDIGDDMKKLRGFIGVIRNLYTGEISLSDKKLLERILDKNFINWKLSGSHTSGSSDNRRYLICGESFIQKPNGEFERMAKDQPAQLSSSSSVFEPQLHQPDAVPASHANPSHASADLDALRREIQQLEAKKK